MASILFSTSCITNKKIVIHVDVQQTQPLDQSVWLCVHVMGTVEWPHVQQSIPIINTQTTIEIASTCAYYQQVGHDFKNCPFVDDKLKRLMSE
jgi:hypothetical protein